MNRRAYIIGPGSSGLAACKALKDGLHRKLKAAAARPRRGEHAIRAHARSQRLAVEA